MCVYVYIGVFYYCDCSCRSLVARQIRWLTEFDPRSAFVLYYLHALGGGWFMPVHTPHFGVYYLLLPHASKCQFRLKVAFNYCTFLPHITVVLHILVSTHERVCSVCCSPITHIFGFAGEVCIKGLNPLADF